jgi:hypothetical protein
MNTNGDRGGGSRHTLGQRTANACQDPWKLSTHHHNMRYQLQSDAKTAEVHDLMIAARAQ